MSLFTVFAYSVLIFVLASDGAPIEQEQYPGTQLRPVLSDQEAEQLTLEKYLEPWSPEVVVVPDEPQYVVGRDQSYNSIQAAVNAAILENANGLERQYIFVESGTYEETVFIPSTSFPLTIYGSLDTKIVLNQPAGMTVEEWIAQVNPNGSRYKPDDPAYSIYNGCAKKAASDPIGTRCTAVMWVKGSDVQLFNLTVENSADQAGDAQAVALKADGTRIHLERLSLLGHQDTFYISSGTVFVNNSHITGDTDYVFGEGTAVFNNCTFTTVADRKNSGIVFAPKTAPNNKFGFVIVSSSFHGDENFQNNSKVLLGRPWDSANYIPNESANGEILIRESSIDNIINRTAPWGPGIGSHRPFIANIDENRDLNDNNFNRFWEYKNYGAGV